MYLAVNLDITLFKLHTLKASSLFKRTELNESSMTSLTKVFQIEYFFFRYLHERLNQLQEEVNLLKTNLLKYKVIWSVLVILLLKNMFTPVSMMRYFAVI